MQEVVLSLTTVKANGFYRYFMFTRGAIFTIAPYGQRKILGKNDIRYVHTMVQLRLHHMSKEKKGK